MGEIDVIDLISFTDSPFLWYFLSLPGKNFMASENSDVLSTEAWVFVELLDLDFYLNAYSL